MTKPQLTDLLTRADLRTMTIRADGRPLTDAEKALVFNASWDDLRAARDALAANVANAQVEIDWAHELRDLLAPYMVDTATTVDDVLPLMPPEQAARAVELLHLIG